MSCEIHVMNEKILQSGETAAVIQAIRHNTFTYMVRRAKIRKARVCEGEDLTWTFENPSRPLCLINHPLPTINTDREIQHILRRIEAEGVTQAGIDVVEPVDRIERWEAVGLRNSETEYGMAMPLVELDESLLMKDQLVFEVVQDEEGLEICAEVITAGRGQEVADFFRVIHGNPVEEEQETRFYIARLDERPVAISGQFFAAGVGAIWWVTTVPEYRKKGIGSAVTVAALLDA